jgi:hypothetical protein
MATTSDKLIFEAVKLTADRAERTFRANLLPFGEQGSTSAGRVTAARGSVRLPKDPAAIVGRLGHDDPDQPAASVASELLETDQGVMLAGKILNSDEGDRLLAEIEDGTRAMVSVEVARPVIKGGELVGGTLYAYAHVPAGAFASARLVAEDHGDLGTKETIDRLTAESVKYKKRAQEAERELAVLKAELAGLTARPSSVADLRHRLEEAMGVSGRR